MSFVHLSFEPPAWPILYGLAAAIAIILELVQLARWIRRGRTPAGAAALTVGVIAAGPIIAVAGWWYSLVTSHPDGPVRGRRVAVAGLRGSLLGAMVAASILWRPAGTILVIAAAAAAWVARSYARTTADLSPQAKRLLIALRVAVVIIIAAWALRPTLHRTRTEPIRPTLLIAVDTSASMQQRDAAPGPDLSRQRAVLAELRDNEAAIEALAEKLDVELVEFDDSPRTTARWTAAQSPDVINLAGAKGEATAIGDCIQAAVAAHLAKGEPVAGVVLISDGCNNTSENISPRRLAQQMRNQGVKIHTVGVGSDKVSELTMSLRLVELAAPDRVESFHRMPIRAAVAALGITAAKVKLTCRFDDELVATKTITIDSPNHYETVEFTHIPSAIGFHRVSVEAEYVGDAPKNLPRQPAPSRLVHVVESNLRLLYIEGGFRYESKYIARALNSAERFSVDRRILAQPREANSPATLSEKLTDWLPYHAIILGDVAASQFTDKQLEIMHDLVSEHGKGLAMIGGRRSFGAGGWADTPLADLMPVDLVRSWGQIDGPVTVTPSPDGLASPIMLIGDQDEDAASAWATLDPLEGADKLAAPKPAASVLAVTEDGSPLIVTQQYGRGRTMAIAFDTTYQWVLTPKDTADLQIRFWRQVAMFLCNPAGNIWITTDRSSYDQRRLTAGLELIEVTAGLEDAGGKPMLDSPVEATLTLPNGTTTSLELEADEMMLSATLGPAMLAGAGAYKLTITAELEGERLSREHQFDISRRDLEAMSPLADLKLMREIAAAGNGRYVPLEQLGSLLKDLNVKIEPRSRKLTSTVDLSAILRWPIVILLISLLCAEWTIRKKMGLV